MVHDSFLLVLRPNSEMMHPTIFCSLLSQLESVMDEVSSYATGASYPAVRDVDVMSLKVPVPSHLSDQCSIADPKSLRSAILGQRRCEEDPSPQTRRDAHPVHARAAGRGAEGDGDRAGAGQLGTNNTRAFVQRTRGSDPNRTVRKPTSQGRLSGNRSPCSKPNPPKRRAHRPLARPENQP